MWTEPLPSELAFAGLVLALALASLRAVVVEGVHNSPVSGHPVRRSEHVAAPSGGHYAVTVVDGVEGRIVHVADRAFLAFAFASALAVDVVKPDVGLALVG